jgi:hypothetical protein
MPLLGSCIRSRCSFAPGQSIPELDLKSPSLIVKLLGRCEMSKVWGEGNIISFQLVFCEQ